MLHFIFKFFNQGTLFLLNMINLFLEMLEMKCIYIIYFGKKMKMNVIDFCC